MEYLKLHLAYLTNESTAPNRELDYLVFLKTKISSKFKILKRSRFQLYFEARAWLEGTPLA